MATNPPITIGPFANVPAPGSGIKSDWAQQISTYVAPTVWTAPILTNAWANLGAGYQTARYRKIGDMVYIEGAIAGGTIGQPAFTLPAGFRPAASHQFAVCGGSNVFAVLFVSSAGLVQPNSATNATFFLNCRFSTL